MTPTSFNELISEAKRRGLLLNSFHQTDDGVWIANWRTAPHERAPTMFYDVACSDKPFTALLDALALCGQDEPPKGFFD